MNEKNIILQIDSNKITLENLDNGVYKYEFVKSLSNVNSEADILPLCITQPAHIPCQYQLEDDLVVLTYQIDEKYSNFDNLRDKATYEKLHILKNIKKIIENRELGYTYILHPDNIVYDDNYLPLTVYVGFQDIFYPLSQNDEDILYQYKCLVTYLFEVKYDFDSLYNGGLDILNKTKFLQKIYECSTIEDLVTLLEDSFIKENETFHKTNKVVSANKYNLFRTFSIAGIAVSVVALALLANAYMRTIPYTNRMNEASYAFVSQDYGKVVSTLRNDNASALPVTQKYMLAYSYIIAEPMNETSRKSALSVISTKSDEAYLTFWIYIGQENYVDAIELAKELSDLRLQYHAYYRAIEIIKNDQNMSGSTKEEKINTYEEQLGQVEERLFGNEE